MRRAILLSLLAVAISVALTVCVDFTVAAWLMVPTLGAALVPVLSSSSGNVSGVRPALFTTAGSVLGVCLCWHHHGRGELLDGLQTAAVVVALYSSEAAAVLLFRRWLGGTLAAGLVTVVTMVWLAWPAWASTAPASVVQVHPLLAINGIVAADLGVWSEQPVLYRISVFGQDVPYTLPATPWACVAVHAVMAAGLLGAGRLVRPAPPG